MKYFDKINERLIYVEQNATSDYWDEQWNVENFKKEVTSIPNGVYVEQFTKKYLPLGASVLEGGCGKGQYVYALKRWGYKPTGLDYAEKTVARIKEYFPELDIVKGDVRSLPFNDQTFDGYWSFGVIEHFYSGFESIAKEMQRVIKPGGFLFLTFPHMSKLRRLKARRNKYPLLEDSSAEPAHFYQFALDENKVQTIFEQYRFTLKEKYFMDGVKGLKDEVSRLKPILQPLYNSSFLPFKIIRKILNQVTKHWTSHSVLLVFQKN